jgi:hypothetical protein
MPRGAAAVERIAAGLQLKAEPATSSALEWLAAENERMSFRCSRAVLAPSSMKRGNWQSANNDALKNLPSQTL